VLEAVAHHARHEAELGGYVAEAAAENLLQQGRSVIGGLVGMAAADVVFVESAQAALTTLLAGWQLPAGARVACLPGEYGPSIAVFGAAGLRPEPLPVDGLGRADVDGVARLLAQDPPRFVHLTHVPSHRGSVQPAAEIAALCRAAGVPLVVDAAQSLGHVDVDLGADAVYSTSRKWLAGPRGVGILCVRPALAADSPRCCPCRTTSRRCAPSNRGRRTWPAASGWCWRSASTSPRGRRASGSGSPRWAGPPASCSTAPPAGG
jgi:pyridoxal 5-phosphate dependent beta-lyase